jgi:hypothetical protein
MAEPDTRPRHEKLLDLLEFAHLIGGSPAEEVFREFVHLRGRNPSAEEGKEIGLGPTAVVGEPYPPAHECETSLYLEAIAEKLRNEPELNGPLAKLPDWGGPQVVRRFLHNLELRKRRSGAAELSPKDILRCSLLALGLPATTAHAWLKGLPDEGSPRSHFVCFLVERCLFRSPTQPGKYYKATSAKLHRAYLQWCKGCPRCRGDREPHLRCNNAAGVRLQQCAETSAGLGSEKPYRLREFSSEILKSGGVTHWRTKRARGFSGIALR